MKERTMTMEIKNAYLMWVGCESYGTIADWTEEALRLGVSKRLPTEAAGLALTEPGTVVFVAHDEGAREDCPHCVAEIECPCCRKRVNEISALDSAIKKAKRDLGGAEITPAFQRFVQRRLNKITELEAACASCEECSGAGVTVGGTGGTVKMKSGETWDYRRYTYWLIQPKKFDPAKMVESTHICKECGGKGLLPDGKIFGMVIPDRIEYIAREDDSAAALKALRDKGFAVVSASKLVKEPKRKCGRRKPGGVYLASAPDAKRDAGVKESLKEVGIPTDVEVHGAFISFLAPVPVDEKRFRGLKRIALEDVAQAAIQAEMIKEAMEE